MDLYRKVVKPEDIEVSVLAAAMKHLRFEINPESLEILDNDTASIVNKVRTSCLQFSSSEHSIILIALIYGLLKVFKYF